MTQALCITGMHRSGTSLAASWLERCQLTIADGRLLGPGVGNPRGHFEDLDFSDLQDAAIKRAHGSWRVSGSEPLSFDASEVEQAQRLIDQRNDAHQRWGWKDPRTVLFLREWKDLIPGLKVLIVWRPCAEVVDSLRARARAAPPELDLDIGVREAVRVWCRYNAEACAFAAAHADDVMLVPIRSLIAGDRALLDDINRRWHVDLRYTPLGVVRDHALLRRRAMPWTHLSAWLGRAKPIERRLRRLSWRPPSRARPG